MGFSPVGAADLVQLVAHGFDRFFGLRPWPIPARMRRNQTGVDGAVPG